MRVTKPQCRDLLKAVVVEYCHGTIGHNEGQYEMQEDHSGSHVGYRIVRWVEQQGARFPLGAEFVPIAVLFDKLKLWEQSLKNERVAATRQAQATIDSRVPSTNGQHPDRDNRSRTYIHGGFREIAERLRDLEDWKDEMERCGLGLHELPSKQ